VNLRQQTTALEVGEKRERTSGFSCEEEEEEEEKRLEERSLMGKLLSEERRGESKRDVSKSEES